MFRPYSTSTNREIDDNGRYIDVNGNVTDKEGDKVPARRNSMMKGSEYKLLHKSPVEGIPYPHRLSLILSVDGAQIKNKSRMVLTPLTFTIAELDNDKRYSRKNVMMVACEVSRKKPVSYQPLLRIGFWNQLKKLVGNKLILYDDKGKKYKFSLAVLALVADQPATCSAALHMAHNSFFGCTQCDIETTLLPAVVNAQNVRVQGAVVFGYQESYEKRRITAYFND